MRLLDWVQARDRNAVLVGALVGPLLGLGIALATEPPQIVSGSAGAGVALPPRSSVGGTAPAERLPDAGTEAAASTAHNGTEAKPVARRRALTPERTVTPTSTPMPTATPSPTPAPPDGDGEKPKECTQANGGASDAQPAGLEGKPDKCKPAEDEPPAGPPDPPCPSLEPPEVCEP